ncbi:hypothetical protein HGA01_20250 [Gordonia amicalis]|nr:hypothetical protein [Gordonia amicalis]GAC55288.1 hypothetical protein GOAMI_49_00550 [Gordonia amicalis NBRC 100051 = JCM 11271]
MSSTGFVRVWHFSKGWGVFDSPDTPGGVYADAQSLRLLAVADLNDPLASMGLRPGTEVEFVWSDAADDPLEGLRYEVQQAWPIGVAATPPSPPAGAFSTTFWTSEGDAGPDGLTSMREHRHEQHFRSPRSLDVM